MRREKRKGFRGVGFILFLSKSRADPSHHFLTAQPCVLPKIPRLSLPPTLYFSSFPSPLPLGNVFRDSPEQEVVIATTTETGLGHLQDEPAQGPSPLFISCPLSPLEYVLG